MSETGESILRGMREAAAWAQGESVAVRTSMVEVDVPDVAALRKRLGLSQRAFAEEFGFAVGSIRNWEQKRRRPEGPALTLLRVIDHNPGVVRDAIVAVNAAMQ